MIFCENWSCRLSIVESMKLRCKIFSRLCFEVNCVRVSRPLITRHFFSVRSDVWIFVFYYLINFYYFKSLTRWQVLQLEFNNCLLLKRKQLTKSEKPGKVSWKSIYVIFFHVTCYDFFEFVNLWNFSLFH